MVIRIALVVLVTLFGVYAVWIEPNWIDVSIHDMRSANEGDAILNRPGRFTLPLDWVSAREPPREEPLPRQLGLPVMLPR
jgi:hypothetical protein